MVQWKGKWRQSPIGVDIGSRSVKLLQLNASATEVRAAARWDLPPEGSDDPAQRTEHVVEVIRRARQRREFRGKQAVFCLGAADLFVQNVRVTPASGDELTRLIHGEVGARLPFAREDSEVRYLEADDVRQGDGLRREVIVLACARAAVQRILDVGERAGLVPRAIDVEPSALLRCYGRQFRRDDDHDRRLMFVNVGASNTTVVIASGARAKFVKYVDLGGKHLDEAVARHLKMSLEDATALRRHNGDRRADQRDPEVTRGIGEAIRPVLDRLVGELSLCVRYHSVTFRGQPLSQLTLGGGEATDTLAQWLAARLNLPCDLGNPLRGYEYAGGASRMGQWDVAVGLALRDVN